MIKGKFQDLIKGENSLRKKEQASEPDSNKADLLELWGQEFFFFFWGQEFKTTTIKMLKVSSIQEEMGSVEERWKS